MDARFQRRIQRYGWDKAAGHYERFWGRQLLPALEKLLEMADLQPGERVLDVACGTGLITFPAQERVGSGGFVVGTDISEAMVTGIREEASRRGLANADFHRCDMESLSVGEEPFDVVLVSLGLMYAADPAAAVREIHRVLKPGGRTVISIWGRRTRCGWADIFPIVDSRVESEVCPLFFQLGVGESLAQLLQENGLGEVQVERIETLLAYDSDEDACGAAFAGGPVALAYSKFDDATRKEAQAEYVASIESFRQGRGFRIPGEFVIARAVRS